MLRGTLSSLIEALAHGRDSPVWSPSNSSTPPNHNTGFPRNADGLSYSQLGYLGAAVVQLIQSLGDQDRASRSQPLDIGSINTAEVPVNGRIFHLRAATEIAPDIGVVSVGPISIDVVIPLYNKRRYVRSALDSVLEQSLLPTRIIVVDDGSTDGGGLFVSSFFPTVELIHQENQGVGFARNTGLSSASSAWVAFLDADDVWLPNHLSEISTLCNEFPSAGLVGTSHIQAANVADLDPIVDLATERRIVNYFKEAAQDIGIIWTSATAVHRESALTVGGFGTAPLGQDLESWARMALQWAVAYSTARTAVHRRATGGAMDSAQFPASVASHVRHISPAAETVYSSLMDGNCWVEHADLLDYLDSRVAAAMMMRLARTDVKGARQLRRLAHRP